MDDKFLKVQEWIKRIPVTDNPFDKHNMLDEEINWDVWINEGKKIRKIEEILLEMLNDDKFRSDKILILVAIGLIGSRKSYSDLIHFAKDENVLVRIEAITAIGNLKLQEAVEFLCELSNDKDQNVRANVFVALGKLKGEKAFQCLRNGLNDSVQFVRNAAKTAIESYRKNN